MPEPQIGLAELNGLLDAGRARADELEARLAALLKPILDRAADQAARRFGETATDFLTAAGAKKPGPPPWGAPAPDELIDVDALAALITSRTAPVRKAFLKAVMAGTLAKAGISFDVTNPFVARALAETASQIPHIAETTRGNLMRIIAKAYEEGLSIPDTASLIRAGMKAATPARAVTIARCLPPDALVDGAVVRAVTRRWYEGDMAVLVTESGREFTATPNHPMLTSCGWHGAGDVQEGDYLLCRIRDKYASSARDEDVAGDPPSIAEIFEAAAAIGIVERRTGGQPDFHGDGLDGEVEIARPHRELALGTLAEVYEHVVEDILSPADVIRGTLFCPSCAHLLAVDKSTCICGTPCPDVAFAKHSPNQGTADTEPMRERLDALACEEAVDDFLLVHESVSSGRRATSVREVVAACFRKRTSGNTALLEPVEDRRAIYSNSFSDVRCAVPGDVEADRVIACRLVPYSGHVFNLVTPHGYFTVNGGYTGNTELAGAVNSGSLAAVGIVDSVTGGGHFKVWLTAPGAPHPRHEDYEGLDHQTVPLDAYFDVGGSQLQYPADPNGDPAETINCRCSIIFSESDGSTGLAGESE